MNSFRSKEFSGMELISLALKSRVKVEQKAFLIKAGRHFKAEHEARWNELLAECSGNISEAEHFAISELIPPPHWNTWVNCMSCGPVKVRDGRPLSEEPESVVLCPWCGFMSKPTDTFVSGPVTSDLIYA